MADAVLHDRENVLVLSRLDEQRLVRMQSDLLDPRAEEVEAGDRPDDHATARAQSGGDARQEERRSRVVDKCGRAGRHLMQR